jgi:SagB-type dehydrogenase family enzyme
MQVVNQITLPQDVLDRVARVLDYHVDTKHTHESVRAGPHKLDPSTQPYEFRVFEMLSKRPLPTNLLDLPVGTLALMENGLGALPDSQVTPPQDLKTLATWLHFADGIAQRKRTVTATTFTRTVASDGNTFPCEIYVAAFAIDGLEPALYHYSPREFALRKMRGGAETLARLTRGRPDLAFLRTVPVALLVSTIWCRSTWRFGKRGYRHALHDAGYLIQNCVTVGTGLGIQTITRMILNDSATRELIGVPVDADFDQAEGVQAMIVWADRAVRPLAASTPARAPSSPADPDANGAPTEGSVPAATAPSAAAAPMPPIVRPLLSGDELTCYVSILSTHQDCVAPGVAIREIRPPLTELTPLPPNFPTVDPLPPMDEKPDGDSLRKILLTRQPSSEFAPRSIPRDQFMLINRLAFRGGTFFPLHPDGPHVALVRPFWLIHDVVGMDGGVWYYHPPSDGWSILKHGRFRRDAAVLSLEQVQFGQASATCLMLANLQYLMAVAGPDIYRLAHLEAGTITNRLALSSEALDLAWCETGSFYDDDVRQFLGLRQTGWEVLNIVALGTRLKANEVAPLRRTEVAAAGWIGATETADRKREWSRPVSAGMRRSRVMRSVAPPPGRHAPALFNDRSTRPSHPPPIL